MKDIVLIHGANQLDGQTHLLGEIASEDIAKIACRHHKADFITFLEILRLGQGGVCVKVVSDLCQDSGPVDRVDGSYFMCPIDVGVAKKGLHEILAGVERAIGYGNAMDILVQHGCHLRFLDLTNFPTAWKHDDDGEISFSSKAVDSRRARVTASGSNDGEMLAFIFGSVLVAADKEVLK